MTDDDDQTPEMPDTPEVPVCYHNFVNAEPTETMMMAGVSAIIGAGLDGPDGVGMADAAAVWRAMADLSQSTETGTGERE